jgi:hypothetical protein
MFLARFNLMTNLLNPFDVDCRRRLASDFSLLVDVVRDFVCSKLIGDNERFNGIIPGKTRLNIDVSLRVN